MAARYQGAVARRKAHDAELKDSVLNLRAGFNAWGKDNTTTTSVYTNTLESTSEAVGGAWTTRVEGGVSERGVLTTVSPNGTVRFLGEFGNQDVHLRLSKLPEHRSVSIQFDLLICGFWVGDHYWNGPSLWRFGLANGETLLNTSFMNTTLLGAKCQSYPAAYPGGHNDHYFASKAHDTLGYHAQTPQSDSIYHLAYTFDGGDPDLDFVFQANGLRGLDQACWGLKNVEVTVGTPAPPKPTPPAAPKSTVAETPKPTPTTAVHKAASPTRSARKSTHKIVRKTHSTPGKKKAASTAATQLHDKKKALTP
jgi:hypothetical protein